MSCRLVSCRLVAIVSRGFGGGGPRPVSREFTALAAAWDADMTDRDLALATRDAYGRVCRAYLVFLEARGIACLGGADGSSVLGFLDSLAGTWATSSLFWVVSNFRPFLKFTRRNDLVDAAGLAGVRRSHAILPVLPDKVERLVVHACATPAIAAQDAAITLLAVTTGLRAWLHQWFRTATGGLPRVQGEDGLLRQLPDLVPEAVRRLRHRTRADRLRL